MRLVHFKIIFFFIPHHHIGGAERVHLNIIKSLYFKPIVLFDYSDSNEITQEFRDSAYCFFITNERRKKFAFLIIKIISYFFSVTIFGCNSKFFYCFISKLNGKVRSIDLTHAFSFLEQGMEIISLPYIKSIDKRIVINQKTRNDYESLYKEYNINSLFLDRFTVIPNGILISEYRNMIKSRFENFTVGFVGRNSPEKRPEIFFEIIKQLNVKAKVIGDNFENYKNNYPDVTYFENCNTQQIIRTQFSEISLLIVTSSREGFPLVIMEAMELGIPVIAADVGSIFEHVIDDKNGFLLPVNDKEFIEIAIQKICKLKSDKELYSKISIAARIYAEQYFNIEIFNKQYQELFYE